jgi:hypothetical protein
MQRLPGGGGGGDRGGGGGGGANLALSPLLMERDSVGSLQSEGADSVYHRPPQCVSSVS